VPNTRQLLLDPNFDLANGSWTQNSLSGYSIITTPPSGVPAQSAPNVGWEGGYLSSQDDLYQDVMVPANATLITFSFYYLIGTQETGTTAYDQMAAYVFDPTTQQGTTLATFSNLDESTQWMQFSVQIPLTWAGRVAEFGFYAQTDNQLNTNFFIDSASVTVIGCP
jgi:hypothetical protein